MAEPEIFSEHDHARCAARGIDRADRIAREKGLRFTPVRRRTLEILLEDHRALGAYEVLDQLAESGFGHQPPVAYRALEFLVSNGLAHRVQRLNAYTACIHPGESHTPAFFICESCRAVAEAPAADIRAAIGRAADALGFAVARTSVEVVGLCPVCQDAA